MPQRNIRVFIVKIWKDKPENINWCGQIQDINNGQKVIASNLNELLDHFQHCLLEESEDCKYKKQGLR